MKLFAAITLTLACALAASAQSTSNVSGVTLSGHPADPIIGNHSGKQIHAVLVLRQYRDDKFPVQNSRLFTREANEFPDGASLRLGTGGQGPLTKNNPDRISSATLSAVIFADGEYRGTDGPKKNFRAFMELEFRFMREASQWAQAGEWDKVKARAEEQGLSSIATTTAARFLQARGNSTAMAALTHYGLLPASTWTAGR